MAKTDKADKADKAEKPLPRWLYRNGTSDGRLVEDEAQEARARADGYIDIDEIDAVAWNGGVPQFATPADPAAGDADKKKK